MKTASLYKAIGQITGCCFFMLITFAASAQTRGKLEVIKDPRVDTLIARQAELHKGSAGGGALTAQGYRVQIYNSTSRQEAFDIQSKFQDKFPDYRTYITYREPNFKLRIGDFRTRLEATKMLEQLKPWFTGMFIIPETINLPKLDSSDND